LESLLLDWENVVVLVVLLLGGFWGLKVVNLLVCRCFHRVCYGNLLLFKFKPLILICDFY